MRVQSLRILKARESRFHLDVISQDGHDGMGFCLSLMTGKMSVK